MTPWNLPSSTGTYAPTSRTPWSVFSNPANSGDSPSSIQELEELTCQPGFWLDHTEAARTLRTLENLRNALTPWLHMQRSLTDLEELAAIAQEQHDDATSAQVQAATDQLRQELRQHQSSLAMDGPHDQLPAIITITSGAGGTDSHDWTEMLLGMYTAWAKAQGHTARLMNAAHAERAGLRTATIEVDGHQAYGLLRDEAGVHRVARVSRFDPAGRRQTSFARVEVMPSVPQHSPTEPNLQDIRTETFGASGPGGQHIQKVETAVRLTHLPTGIVVTCQTERSQKQNKEYAMQLLRARLLQHQEAEQQRQIAALKGQQPPPEWGHQIRSYFLRPQHLVVDHRSGHRETDPNKVLSGNISGFLEAALINRSKQQQAPVAQR